MPKITKQKMLEKQAKDMIDMAKVWMELAPTLYVKPESKKAFDLFDAMQIQVLKTYTNIEEKINDKKD